MEKQSRWYFDQSENRCMPFYYTGCGGNNNNFESRDACESDCPPKIGKTSPNHRETIFQKNAKIPFPKCRARSASYNTINASHSRNAQRNTVSFVQFAQSLHHMHANVQARRCVLNARQNSFHQRKYLKSLRLRESCHEILVRCTLLSLSENVTWKRGILASVAKEIAKFPMRGRVDREFVLSKWERKQSLTGFLVSIVEHERDRLR